MSVKKSRDQNLLQKDQPEWDQPEQDLQISSFGLVFKLKISMNNWDFFRNKNWENI